MTVSPPGSPARSDSPISQFTSPNALACYGGKAPVTRRSGRSEFTVARRLAHNGHLADAVQLWAFCSLTRSGWAREFYDSQIAKNKSHHSALRALAAEHRCDFRLTRRLAGSNCRTERPWSFAAALAAVALTGRPAATLRATTADRVRSRVTPATPIKSRTARTSRTIAAPPTWAHAWAVTASGRCSPRTTVNRRPHTASTTAVIVVAPGRHRGGQFAALCP